MKRLLGLCCLLSLPAFAQELNLPAKSPGAKVTQTVGLTDITVEYSSPGVKGRPIWGALVPYGKTWRAGANEATRITFSKEVTVGDKQVPAGTYSFFTVPNKGKWTLILNKDPKQFGAFEYKPETDLVRVEVTPKAIPHRERLAYLVSDFTDDNALITLEWEKLSVSLPVKLATQTQSLANIKEATDDAWVPLMASARYLLEQKKDLPTAVQYVDKSIAIKQTWLNTFVKAQLLAATGNVKDARALAEKAMELGAANPQGFYGKPDVEKALNEWKGKS